MGDEIKKNEVGAKCSMYGGERRGAYGVLVGKLGERDCLEGVGVNRRIIFSCIFKNWDGGHKLDWSGSEQGQIAGCCECDNEPPLSVKYAEFFD